MLLERSQSGWLVKDGGSSFHQLWLLRLIRWEDVAVGVEAALLMIIVPCSKDLGVQLRVVDVKALTVLKRLLPALINLSNWFYLPADSLRHQIWRESWWRITTFEWLCRAQVRPHSSISHFFQGWRCRQSWSAFLIQLFCQRRLQRVWCPLLIIRLRSACILLHDDLSSALTLEFSISIVHTPFRKFQRHHFICIILLGKLALRNQRDICWFSEWRLYSQRRSVCGWFLQ